MIEVLVWLEYYSVSGKFVTADPYRWVKLKIKGSRATPNRVLAAVTAEVRGLRDADNQDAPLPQGFPGHILIRTHYGLRMLPSRKQ